MSALGKLVVSLALEYAEYTRGLSKADQEALKFAQNAQRHFDMATGATKEFFTGVLQGAVGAVSAYLSVSSAITVMKKSIDEMDAIDELSEKLMIDTKTLQEYAYAGKLTGVELEGLGTGFKKLQVNMTESITGGKEQAALFKAIGVSVKGADGTLRDAKDVMLDVANVFSSLEDGALKATLATKLFGKQGADMIPFLNQGADGIKKLTDEANSLGGVLSGEQLKTAAEFNDNLDRMSTLSGAAAKQFTVSFIPAINDVIKRLIEAQKESKGFLEALRTAATMTFDKASGESYGKQIQKLQAQIDKGETARASRDKLPSLLRGFVPSDEEMDEAKRRLRTLKNYQASLALEGTAGTGDRWDRYVSSVSASANRTPDSKAIAAVLAETDTAAKAANKELAEQAKLIAELAGLTGSFSEDWSHLNKMYQKGVINLDQLTDLQKKLLSQQPAIKKAADLEAKAASVLADEWEEAAKAKADYDKQYGDKLNSAIGMVNEYGRAIDENNNLAQFEIRLLGQTEQARETALAQYRIQLDLEKEILRIKQLGLNADDQAQQIARAREVAARASEGAAARVTLDYWRKINDDIGRSLTDALMNGGKNAGELLKNYFKTLVLRPLIEAVVAPISGAVTKAMIGGQGSSGAGGAGNLFSMGKTLWDGFNSGFSATGGQVAQYAQSGINYVTGSGGMVSQGPIQVGSFAQGVGTAASYLGGASIGVYGGRALSNGYAISGSGNGVVNAGTAIGAVLGGPIGAAIGGLIGGAANRLFGMRAKEYTSAGIQGNFNQEGFTDGKNFQRWEQKGGVFRSDKDGTDYRALDALYSKALGDGFKALKSTTSDFAQSLGLNAGLIAGYAKGMVIDLTGDQVKDAEILAKAFGDMGDEMATILLPNFKEFQKTGESASATLGRLASVNQTVDGVFGTIGIDAVAAFNGVGVAAANAKQRLVDVAGGMDAFLAKSNFFVSNFLSEAEQLKPASDRIAAVFARHNIAGDISKDDFAARVKKALLDTSDAGKAMANELLEIAPLFLQVANFAEKSASVFDKAMDTVVDTIDDVADTAAIAAERIHTALDGVATAYDALQRSVEAERESVTKAYEAAIAPITKSIDKLKGLSQSLHSALDGRRIEAQFGADRAAAQAQIATALAIARAGGVFPDADALSRALSLVSQPSEQLFATFEDYQRDFLRTSNDIDNLAALTDDQLSVDERRLKAEEEGYKAEMAHLDGILSAAQAEVDAINGVNTSVLSVAAAIAGLNGAIVGAKAVGANPVAGSGSGANSAVASLYERFSDSSYMTAEGAAYWAARVNSGESTASIEQSFQDSVKAVRGFAVGTNYVPNTGMAIIHEGERIIPAADNRELMARLQSPSESSAVLAAEVRALKGELERIRKATEDTEEHASKTANDVKRQREILDAVVNGDASLTTEAA